MDSNTPSLTYMRVKGSTQGAFLDDSSRAGGGRSLCHAVRFRGEVPHDVRKTGAYAVTQHEPISVLAEWGTVTVQFLTALWNNETLDEVEFDFVRSNPGGHEVTYATLTLKKATVAYAELRSGATQDLLAGDHHALHLIGLRAEKIEFKVKGPAGDAIANYDQKAGGS